MAMKAQAVEELFRVKKTRTQKSPTPDEEISLIHELRGHQIELESQFKELSAELRLSTQARIAELSHGCKQTWSKV